ncbi:murein biosynthesis integral membrane protein MurJ [Candidatus Dependentiae bacterium]|nr:murein biosynthesis integral membrane protein MurJ [Candidatus Dependentiae bacterium]
MRQNLTKKSILKKAAQFGGVTFLSRIFGIIREMLLARTLGVGAISDAFLIAFKIPSFFRRIFAEGSLSAAFVPVFVKKIRKKKFSLANSLMSSTFLFFEGIVLLLVVLVAIFPRYVFYFAAPGFTEEQLKYAIPFLRILFPMLFFYSSSALFAGALNSVNHVLIPAAGPVVMNIVLILFLLGAKFLGFSLITVCYGILLSGFIVFLMHLITFFYYNFKFERPVKEANKSLRVILSKFLPSLLGVSIIEINLFADTAIASYLKAGNVSMMHYAGRFMNLPIGVFAVGFATIILPHFSRYAAYAPKRLKFQIFESTKLITWLILPAMLFLMFVSKEIFTILMFGKVTTMQNALIAKNLLMIYLSALVFYCLNKVLVNVFYALNNTVTPTIALVISSIVNICINIIGMIYFGAFGIAASTALSGVVLTVLYFIFLHKKYNYKFYYARYFQFLIRYIFQLILGSLVFFSFYKLSFFVLSFTNYFNFFKYGFGFWIIVMPLAAIISFFIYKTSKLFGIKLYFLSK